MNRILPVAGGIASIATLLLGAAGTASADTEVTGSAVAISAQASVLNALQLDVPALPEARFPAGGTRSLLSLDLGRDPALVKLHVLHVGSDVEHGKLHSFADLTDVSLLGLVSAHVLDADCTADAATVDGHSDIVDLKIGHLGTPDVRDIKVTANQPINLNALVGGLLDPLVGRAVTVTFDERVRQGNTLTVNALHVHVDTNILGLSHLGLANVLKADTIISQAVCTEGQVPATGGNGGGTGSSGGGTNGGGSGTGSTPGSSATPSQAGGAGATGSPAPSTTAPAVVNAADHGSLAFTGVAGVFPMVIGALVLLVAGGGLFWFTRRKRAANGPSTD